MTRRTRPGYWPPDPRRPARPAARARQPAPGTARSAASAAGPPPAPPRCSAPAAAGSTTRSAGAPRPPPHWPVRPAGPRAAPGPRYRSARPAAAAARPSVAARPGSRARLVTSTRHDGLPGSSGRTCAASSALSRMTSIRLPASTLRYSAACASTTVRDLFLGHPERAEEPGAVRRPGPPECPTDRTRAG